MQEAVAAAEGFLHMPDAFINMGSLFLAMGQPASAIQVPRAHCAVCLQADEIFAGRGGMLHTSKGSPEAVSALIWRTPRTNRPHVSVCASDLMKTQWGRTPAKWFQDLY